MSNFELLILYTFINFIVSFLTYRFFGKNGLIIFIVLSVIAANIQVNKGVEYNIFGYHTIATMGNVMFSGIFMASDLINEKYNRSEARKAILLSLFFGLAFMFLMFIATLIPSVADEQYLAISNALDVFFSLNGGAIKALLIGNFVYLISQLLDVFIYARIKNKFAGFKWLWLRNTGSILLSQIVDTTMITYGLAFAGIIPWEYTLEIAISTLLIKYIIAFINLPLFYLLVFVKPKYNAL